MGYSFSNLVASRTKKASSSASPPEENTLEAAKQRTEQNVQQKSTDVQSLVSGEGGGRSPRSPEARGYWDGRTLDDITLGRSVNDIMANDEISKGILSGLTYAPAVPGVVSAIQIGGIGAGLMQAGSSAVRGIVSDFVGDSVGLGGMVRGGRSPEDIGKMRSQELDMAVSGESLNRGETYNNAIAIGLSPSVAEDMVARENARQSQRDRGGMSGQTGDAAAGAASRGRSSGGCFLTTMCVDVMGQRDDGEMLTTLRKFRDTHLVKSSYGKNLIMKYYEESPHLVSVLESFPMALHKDICESYYQSHLVPCVEAIKKEDYAEAILAYVDLFEELNRIVNHYETKTLIPS